MKTTFTYTKEDIVTAVKDQLAWKGNVYKSHRWEFTRVTDAMDRETGETMAELVVDVELSASGQR